MKKNKVIQKNKEYIPPTIVREDEELISWVPELAEEGEDEKE